MREDEVESEDSVELADLIRNFFRVIRERYYIIAAALVIVVAVTLAISFNTTPQYRASARLLYQRSNLDQALFGSQIFASTNQDREVQTGALLVELEPVAEAVAANLAAELGQERSIESLLDMVDVRTESGTNVVDIEAVSAEAAEAAAVANAFADEFVTFRETTDRATVAAARELVKEELDSLGADDATSAYGLMLKEKYESLRILESMQNGGFIVVQRARTPVLPFTPQHARNAIIAVIVGLLLGLALAFLLDHLDKRVKDEKTLEKELGVPVLASVPAMGGRRARGKKGQDNDSPVGFAHHPELLEAFRTLRSNLQYFSLEKEHSAWLITSGLPQEGKTTTTINLGLSLALSGKRVIVLEADLRRPMVHEYLRLSQNPGLSSVLAGTKKLDEGLQLVMADEFVPSESRRQKGERGGGFLQRNFYVLPSGPLPPNPAELLASERMTRVIEELIAMSDCLLIDTPPLLAVSDALVLAPRVDGVILAARLDETTREEAREVRDILDRAGIRVIGAVASGTRRSSAYYHKRGYGYGYGYDTVS